MNSPIRWHDFTLSAVVRGEDMQRPDVAWRGDAEEIALDDHMGDLAVLIEQEAP